MLSVLFCLNDLVKAHAEYLRKAFEFNVRHEPFSAFYPLYGIFIEIDA